MNSGPWIYYAILTRIKQKRQKEKTKTKTDEQLSLEMVIKSMRSVRKGDGDYDGKDMLKR